MAAVQISVSTQEKRHRKYATTANANNRVGVFWTPEEEANLEREFSEGKSVDEIAQIHQRAPRAIEVRLAKIAANEVTETESITDVCAKYRVTETMVQRELTKKIKKNQPKPPVIKKSDLISRITALEEQVRQLQAQLNLL